MIFDALLAYFHYTSIFLLFAFLTVEAMLLRNPLDAAAARLMVRVDIWYFAAAMCALASGLLRLFFGVKGAAFYGGNPVFYVKIVLFAAIGILSVWPTRTFIRWRRACNADAHFVPPEDERRKARRWVMMEVHLAALIPLLAVLMARGVGY